MLSAALKRPERVLITLDAVGGVWSYAFALAELLAQEGIEPCLLGFGPAPAAAPANVPLRWSGEPLDWLVENERDLAHVPQAIADVAADLRADLVHVSAPSQADRLPRHVVTVAQSHSCVPSWWAGVRGGPLPPSWEWQRDVNRRGLHRADCATVPSASHGRCLAQIYGQLPRLEIVPNSLSPSAAPLGDKNPIILAAGRWWDEGKNATLLDRAAAWAPWPVRMAGALSGPNGAAVQLAHAVPLGQLPPQALRREMRQAAIFASPSLYEPFGLAVLEAADAGAALLLADIPTFRELWSDAALFADPLTPADWSDAIETLVACPTARTALGLAARDRAAAFSTRRQRRALFAAYDIALGHAAAQAV